MLSNRGFALAFECGVDDSELPSGRRFACPDTVLPAIKMYVLGDVASIFNSCEAEADAKIHVRQETMLGVVRANTHCTGITILDFDIDVAHRGIESARIRVNRRINCAGDSPLICSR